MYRHIDMYKYMRVPYINGIYLYHLKIEEEEVKLYSQTT